ncbi:chromatin-remodelling complex, RSC SWI/SNF subunit Rsc7/Swp82 [Purpureocillium lavendulum]|uniref:Chromatin-remodelling complex, RSC SWI/SNF subunit Rsc7/Swp82 n=1 Tax=Purpureocillium lavendulum TaxID=1247861 RepID=A0AB34FCR4_9HYPO|nr:chromatin-remodelling complex, RSC SWI/SNF subunit Rsc7/Swp82 [Purpureocillium lavendulum]
MVCGTAATPGSVAASTYSSGAYPRDWSSTGDGTSSRQITGPLYRPAMDMISTAHEARVPPPDLVGVGGNSSCQRDTPYDHMQTDWPHRPEQPSSPGDRIATAGRPHISAYTAATIAATQPLMPPTHPPQALRENLYPHSLQSHNYINQPMCSQAAGHRTGTYTTQYESVHRAQSPAFHVQQPRAGQDEPIMSFGRQHGSGYGMYLVN